jgi:hypothetical protein
MALISGFVYRREQCQWQTLFNTGEFHEIASKTDFDMLESLQLLGLLSYKENEAPLHDRCFVGRSLS